MSASELFTCTPRQTREFIIDTLQAGLVPFVQSSPGIGKSSLVASIAKEFNLKLIDHRLSTSPPEDLSGLPQFINGKARFAPFEELFPLEDSTIPDGFDGWLLHLDEFNSASKETQAAAYKLILDRMVGQHRLHERVMVVGCGNLATDKAIINRLSTAMQSRLIHIHMVVNFQEWLEDVAIPQQYDARIIAFLSQYNSKLMDFNPDHKEKTFCCPRTWEFVNKLAHNKPVFDMKHAPLLAGTITSGVATEFITFTEIFRDLITVDEIIADPLNCKLPSSISANWALVTHIIDKVTDKNLTPIYQYIKRLDMSFQILFGRMLMLRHPSMRSNQAFIDAVISINSYLTP